MEHGNAVPNRFQPTLAAALLLVLTGAAPVAAAIHGAEWGDSQALVKRSVSHPLHHDIPGELSYWNFELAGVRSGLIYTFEDDKLIEVAHISRNPTPDPREDWEDHQAFLRYNTEQFGEPETREWIWSDGVAAADRVDTVEAIAAGYAVLVTRWQLDDGVAELLIAGEDGSISALGTTFRPAPPPR